MWPFHSLYTTRVIGENVRQKNVAGINESRPRVKEIVDKFCLSFSQHLQETVFEIKFPCRCLKVVNWLYKGQPQSFLKIIEV